MKEVVLSVLVYLTGAGVAFAVLIPLARAEEIKNVRTFDQFIERVFLGPSPVVLLGTVLWPLTIATALLALPVIVVWLFHRRGVLIRHGIDKLNRKAA